MRKIFIYNGYLQTKDSSSIFNALKSILNSSNLRERYASGIQKEIKYEDENKEIYIHDDFDEGFLFSTELKGTFEEAENFIVELSKKLIEKSIPHQFEWSEVDESDDQIGEEFEIRHL